MGTLTPCSVCGKSHYQGSGNQKRCLNNREGKKTSPDVNISRSNLSEEPVDHPVDQHNIDVLEDYGVYRLLTGTIHNSSDRFQGAESYYYATPTGQEEMKRRLLSEDHIDEDYEKFSPFIEEVKGQRIPFITDAYRREIRERAERGKEKIANGEDIDMRDDDVRARLLHLSLEDIRDLTVQESGVIGHYTSNGSHVARGKYIFTDFDRDNQEVIKETMYSIFDRLEPREEKVKLYRGTSMEFVSDVVGEKFTLDNEGLPLSTTYSRTGAERYGDGVVLDMEISNARYLHPGAVSAWGVVELETFLDGDVEVEVISVEQTERNTVIKVRQVID